MTAPTTHRAAGTIFLTPERKALFVKRGPGGSAPGLWAFPGGGIEGDETPEQAARRESNEELGTHPEGALAYHVRGIAPVVAGTAGMPAAPDLVDFTTFVQQVGAEFAPTLNVEHTGYAWASIDAPPEPLHPGCRIALDRFSWNELGVARAIAAGQLTSPQLYGNVWLFDMRITGTGVAYRNEKKDEKGNVIQPDEYVYRRPENYLTEEFVARCNGLQVIMLHPPGAVLTSKEFAARTVGAMMLPYIKGDEVWGIAKIYDEGAVKALTSSQLSTSPGVILGDGNQRMKTEDGTDLLIEGESRLLDHLAICERGVWDKGGEPRGVRTDSQGDINMLTEDDKKVLGEHVAATLPGLLAASLPALIAAGLATARADDAGASGKLDKLLAGLDAMNKRMDAFEEKEKADAAPCFSGRMDGESDEDFKKRHDAEEEAMKADSMKRGDSEEVAGKKAADARKDSEDKEKAKADAARKDAEDKDKDKAKADSVPRSEFDRLVGANIEMAKKLQDVERALPKQLTDEDRRQFGQVQARADEVCSAFGRRAPFPLTGETVFDYRRRLADNLKAHSPAWAGVAVLAIADEATFKIAEDQIMKDAAQASLHPTDLKEGELREIVRHDALTGGRKIEFRGTHSFIRSMKRTPRYVKRIGATQQARA